jgi:serine/threonine protein kinase
VTNKDEEILSDLLLQWEELHETGQDLAASDLCKAYPHLIDELSQRIHAMKTTAWIDEHLEEDESPYDDLQTTHEPRTLIGRYRLEKLVAEGGFAYVWLGFDQELQRPVAVKVPKPNRALSVDSFMAEARRVARLKHPGIIQVYDSGRDGDSCFIVSEFVEGGSLADQLKKNRPNQDQAIRWMIEIAEALEYAHAHGVVHRDIKPANILIDHHHRALLADFGIAQSASKSAEHALSLGTLSYVSPEQLEGKPTDARADVYSLGVMLHEILTGTIPYSSTDPNTLRREIAKGVQSISSPSLSSDFKRICSKALRHDPYERYQSAAHFAADLKGCIKEKSSLFGSGIALLSILAITTSAFALFRPSVTKEVFTIHDATVQVQGAEQISSISQTPDGNFLTSEIENVVRIWNSKNWEPKKEFKGLVDWARCVDISKDGKWIVACTGGHIVDGIFTPGIHNEVVVWDALAGAEVQRIDVSGLPVSTVAISHDGNEILTGSDDKLMKLWDRVTGQEKLCMRGHSLMVRSAKFIPGTRLAASASSDTTIRLWDLDTGEELRSFDGHTESVESIACSFDGKLLVSGAKDNSVRIWDVLTGKQVQVFEGHGNHVVSVCFSVDGRWVLSGSLDRTARLWDVETGKEFKVFEGHPKQVTAVAMSSDGKQVITGCADGRIRVWKLK